LLKKVEFAMREPDRFLFGDFVLERSQQRVLRGDGQALSLTPRLFSALLLFVERPGELLDKDTLLSLLWPGLVVEENNLSQVVSALRRALGDETHGSRFIQTVPRRGFRFIASVTALSGDKLPSDLPISPPSLGVTAPPPHQSAMNSSPSETGALPVPLDEPEGASRDRRRWMRFAVATSACAGIAGAGWWAWRRASTNSGSGDEDASGYPTGATLAVLPFKPVTAQGRDELLELGMADGLAGRLSTVQGLVVRWTGSAMRYAGAAQDLQSAARELDVIWIVDGTVQRQGDQLRVTARLLHVADGVVAWAASFDERSAGLFDVQDRISTEVGRVLTSAVRTRARGNLVQAGGTHSVEAYQLYLAGAWTAQGWDPSSIGKATALLQQAISIDPGYASAWAMLAWTHRRKLWRSDALPSEVFEASNAALKRAIAISPGLAQARAGLAFTRYWYDFDWLGTETEFRKALAANPNEVSGQWGLALLLLTQGRIDEGFEHMRVARELDPLSPVLNALEASLLLDGGLLDDARIRLNRALDIAPRHGLVVMVLGMLEMAENRFDDGIRTFRRAIELGGDESARPQALLAMHLARMGGQVEARAILMELEKRARVRFVPPTSLAMVHAALGNTVAALDLLERAYLVRDTRITRLKDDPSWTPLRDEPRFLALKRKLKLDQYGPGLTPV
jgi:DNA-binding winged helix-turn-helix (wHTH) protein/TolB-like protein/Flp pilus assembly protein TadD